MPPIDGFHGLRGDRDAAGRKPGDGHGRLGHAARPVDDLDKNLDNEKGIESDLRLDRVSLLAPPVLRCRP